MDRAIDNNIKFIHVDEAIFTFNTFIIKSRHKKYDKIEVYDQKVKVATHAILAGICEDSGLESYVIYLRLIKQEWHIEFLYKQRYKQSVQEIILFVDHIFVHKAIESKEDYEELEITPVYNVPYNRQFNGINSMALNKYSPQETSAVQYYTQIARRFSRCDSKQLEEIKRRQNISSERVGRMNVYKQVSDLNE